VCVDKLLGMSEGAESQTGPYSKEKILGRLDKMVASGRVTDAEATRLREANTPAEFEDAVRAIRGRHAAVHLDAAVESGEMTGEDAAAFLERLSHGEHPRSLRSHLRKLRPRSG
jgi:polyhydroxyalkanoate synthesis regulator phasin